MESAKTAIKEEFPASDSASKQSGALNRIRKKGRAAVHPASPSASPGSSPPSSPPAPAAALVVPGGEALSVSGSSSSVTTAAGTVSVVNGCASRLSNGGSPPGGSSPPAPALPPALPVAAVGRSLAKMKRFLTTLVQFGSDISPETGERVRGLVFSLVANGMSLEEFQHALQEATNFPLRGFVLPFLRGQLPALQRELVTLAKASGESALQYLRHHEQLLLDPNPSAGEALDIFHAESGTKRRSSYDSYEDGEEAENLSSWPKRAHVGPSSSVVRGMGPGLGPGPPGSLGPRARHIPPPPQLHHKATHPVQVQGHDLEPARHTEDEWKNINVMLNCVLSMVEKTKQALVILQQRSTGPPGSVGTQPSSQAGSQSGSQVGSQSVSQGGSQASNQTGVAGPEACSRQLKAAVDDILARTLQDAEERIVDLKRRAEEAVNEVRRQALLEIQRAVTAAEAQASELMAAERASVERRLALAVQAQTNTCWNCGRKAHETCSGCNLARYCGAFCQHKDWENHHQACSGSRAATPTK